MPSDNAQPVITRWQALEALEALSREDTDYAAWLSGEFLPDDVVVVGSRVYTDIQVID